MDGILDFFRSIASERRGQSVGRVLTYILITFTIVIVVYAIFLGYGAMVVAAGEYINDDWTRSLVLFTVAVVLVATGIAIVPTLIESAKKHSIWWMNLWRALAIFLFIATVWKLSPFDVGRATSGVLRYVEEFFSADEVPPGPRTPGQPGRRVQLTPTLERVRQREIGRMYSFYRSFRDVDNVIVRVRNFRLLVDTYAQQHGLDPVRVEAIMATESQGKPDEKSDASARGLLQLMDATAREHGAACGLTNPPVESYIPEKNICTGCGYYRFVIDREFGGDDENALAGYNGGPTRVNGVLRQLPATAPRSFWALHVTNDAGGRPLVDQLISKRTGRRETERYVPSVLAWEMIFREYDAQNGTASPQAMPPLEADGVPEEPMPQRPSGVVLASAITPGAEASTGNEFGGSSVWYTAQEGDRLGGVAVLVLRDPRPTELVRLNRDASQRGRLPEGFRVLLPEQRYAFHRADGGASYAEIAELHGMSVDELGRWSGIESCAARDCTDETPPRGTRLLVRRK